MSIRFHPTQMQIQSICSDYISGDSAAKIATEHRVTRGQIARVLKKQGVPIRSLRSDGAHLRYSVEFFDRIDTEYKAYFLGLLYADGNVSSDDDGVQISLRSEDASVLTSMSLCLAKGIDITRWIKVKENPHYGRQLKVTSSRIKSDLAKWGCVPVKTFKIRLPALASDMMPHFFRGYFDGDGCMHVRQGRNASSEKRPTFKIVSCTPFCQDMADYMMTNHGIRFGVYHPSPNPNVASLQSGNDETIKFLYRYMYSNASVFIPRKRTLFETFFRLRGVDPFNESPEPKNRRKPPTATELMKRETKPHLLPLWESKS